MGKLACVRDGDALVLVDVLADFGHSDGEALFAAFREAAPSLEAAIASARSAGVPVIYANDRREMGYQITVLADACSAVDAGNAEVALRYLEHVVGARVESGVDARRT